MSQNFDAMAALIPYNFLIEGEYPASLHIVNTAFGPGG